MVGDVLRPVRALDRAGPHFSLDISVQLALIAIIGGLGTLLGPVIGAALIIPLNMFLRAWLGASYAGLYLVVYGLVLVLVVSSPAGLVVEARGWLTRGGRRRPPRAGRVTMPLLDVRGVSKRFGGSPRARRQLQRRGRGDRGGDRPNAPARPRSSRS